MVYGDRGYRGSEGVFVCDSKDMMAYMLPDRFRGLLLIGACACFSCAWPEKNLRGLC